MKYALALELKNAGYEQKKNRVSFLNNYIDNEGNLITEGEMVYCPSLSELIEACGEKFHGIYIAGGDWKTHGFRSNKEWDDVYTHGSTPSESVARLWLAINIH